tara:strand:+ start:71 stop:1735 length:1665 start_codon:yes stop_codon:yes gene_type:complete
MNTLGILEPTYSQRLAELARRDRLAKSTDNSPEAMQARLDQMAYDKEQDIQLKGVLQRQNGSSANVQQDKFTGISDGILGYAQGVASDRANAPPPQPLTAYGSGSATGDAVNSAGRAVYDAAGNILPPVLDTFADTVEGGTNFLRGAVGMDKMEEGKRFSKGDDFNPFNYKGILGIEQDSSQADLSALEKYRPDGILKNAQDIDMGGKGVLRPDEPNTHTMPDGTVMEGATHEESPVETGALNKEIIDTAEVVESEPASLMADNAIDKQGAKKESPLLGIAQAASIDRSGTATGNKRDSTSMSIPRIGMAERLMRIGGAITGASTQGLSASMAAGAQAYGGLQDEERRLAQVEQQNQMSMLSKLRAMNKPTAQQEKQEAANRETFINTQSMSQRQSFLAKRLRQEGDNVTGLKDGVYGKAKDNLFGHPRAELRLSLEQEAVNATLVSVALTKGAISNREMELFMKPIPKIGINQEATWIAWLEMQSALNAIKAKRYDPSNVNLDGSLKSRIQADAEASAELEQLYQNLLDTGYKEGGGQGQSVPEDDDELFNVN